MSKSNTAKSSRSTARGYQTRTSGNRTARRSTTQVRVSKRGAERGYGQRTGVDYRNMRESYNYGAEARKLEIYPYEEQNAPAKRKKPVKRTRKISEEELEKSRQEALRNRARAQHLSPAMIVGMAFMACIMSLFLLQYISLYSSVSTAANEVASLESQLSDLRSDNDERLGEINAKINLDEIKYKAITELGMSYAKENQIISYTKDDNDYVHQVASIEE